MAGLAQRQCCYKTPFIQTLHGKVEPGFAERRFLLFDLPDNFISDDAGIANIGAHPCTTGLGVGQLKGKIEQVSAKTHQTRSRSGILNYSVVMSHYSRTKPFFQQFIFW